MILEWETGAKKNLIRISTFQTALTNEENYEVKCVSYCGSEITPSFQLFIHIVIHSKNIDGTHCVLGTILEFQETRMKSRFET